MKAIKKDMFKVAMHFDKTQWSFFHAWCDEQGMFYSAALRRILDRFNAMSETEKRNFVKAMKHAPVVAK